MPRHRRRRAAVAVLGLVAALTTVPADAQSPTGAARRHRAACGPVPAERAHCHAQVVTSDDGVTPLASTNPSGGAISPADLRSAYQLPIGSAGSGMTIAIVDAYDNPAAETDLAAYRSHYGLPSCTTANGCFAKVNQSGATGPLPATDVAWGQEIDLDLQMASAVCPNCNIRLVEATTPSVGNLGRAVDTAADVLHADAISNSYGSDEFSSETSASVGGHYNHPAAAITVSSGDNGFGVQFPASSRYVTAVGGTSLRRDGSTRGWGETAWSGAGSGCSAYVPKPAWQADTGCPRRTVADVSAVADPSTGVAVYDSFGSTGGANWFVFGGTSVAAPIVAGVYALGANTASISNASGIYSHDTSVWDVTSGTNAATCTPPYLCSAQPGYDGPTGVGTPRGAGAFGGSSEVTTTTTTSTSTSTTIPPTTIPPTTTTVPPTTSHAVGDFTGDGKTNIGVFRPGPATWFVSGGATLNYGVVGDLAVPADYDGDARTDVAVFRPSTGTWFIRNSANGTDTSLAYGLGSDIAVPGDYDGTGGAEAAVFRPSTGTWYIHNFTSGADRVVNFGVAGDIPVPGDYDGVGRSELAVFRPSSGTWFVLNPATGASSAVTYGQGGDVPVPGDYDGDKKTDMAVYRPLTGGWYMHNSASGTDSVLAYGIVTDIPVAGDYDGDGKTDVGVFRPVTGGWYMRQSSTGTDAFAGFGISGDVPLPPPNAILRFFP